MFSETLPSYNEGNEQNRNKTPDAYNETIILGTAEPAYARTILHTTEQVRIFENPSPQAVENVKLPVPYVLDISGFEVVGTKLNNEIGKEEYIFIEKFKSEKLQMEHFFEMLLNTKYFLGQDENGNAKIVIEKETNETENKTYVIKDLLGEGGMSKVYEVIDKNKLIAKFVALSRYNMNLPFKDIAMSEPYILKFLQNASVSNVPIVISFAIRNSELPYVNENRDIKAKKRGVNEMVLITSNNGENLENWIKETTDFSHLVDLLVEQISLYLNNQKNNVFSEDINTNNLEKILKNPHEYPDKEIITFLSEVKTTINDPINNEEQIKWLKEKITMFSYEQLDKLYELLPKDKQIEFDKILIDKGRFGELFSMLSQLAITLDSVNKVGVCHNDLSLNNLTVVNIWEQVIDKIDTQIKSEAHIIDFGVATKFIPNFSLEEKFNDRGDIKRYLEETEKNNPAFCNYSLIGKLGYLIPTQLKNASGLDRISRTMPHPKKDVSVFAKICFQSIGERLGFDGLCDIVLKNEKDLIEVERARANPDSYDPIFHDFRLQMLMNFTVTDKKTGKEKSFLPESFLASFLRTYNSDEHFTGLYPHEQLELIIPSAQEIADDLKRVFANASVEDIIAFKEFMKMFNKKSIDGKETKILKMERLYRLNRELEKMPQQELVQEDKKILEEDKEILEEIRQKIKIVGTPDNLFNKRLFGF